MKKLVLLLCLLICVPTAYADDKATKASIEKLMELTHFRSKFDKMHAKMSQGLDAMGRQMKVPEKDQPILDTFLRKNSEAFDQYLSWDTMKDGLVEAYANHLNEEEVLASIAFYQSPAGRALATKMPLIINDSKQVSQKAFKELMLVRAKLKKEMLDELSASREAESASENQ